MKQICQYRGAENTMDTQSKYLKLCLTISLASSTFKSGGFTKSYKCPNTLAN